MRRKRTRSWCGTSRLPAYPETKSGHPARYVAELERAADLAQHAPGHIALIGQEMPCAGQTARGLEPVERAVRLDPLAADVYRWNQRNVYFLSRCFQQAATVIEAVRTAPDSATREQLAKEPDIRRLPECEAERAKVAAAKS